MRNRAKCKLCGDILESFHVHDYVTCKCGEIGIDGGLQYAKCSARDWKNFIRIDDNGHEIIPVVKESADAIEQERTETPPALSRKEKIEMLERMIKYDGELPLDQQRASASSYDLYSYMMLVLAILKDENK
jgi:hypothetical protein